MVIVVVMIIGFIPTMTVSAATRDEAVKWAQSQMGKRIYRLGYGQCVDLIAAYYKDVFDKSVYTGNGGDYATDNAAVPSGWTRIKNYTGFIPEPGDIAIWQTTPSSTLGHVAIVESADGSNLTTIEQVDWGNGNWYVGRLTHTYSNDKYTGNFWGVIRPVYSSSSDSSATNSNDPEPGYGEWSSWTETKITATDTKKVQTSTQYRLYQFICDSCSWKSPYWGSAFACPNCNKTGTIKENSFTIRWELSIPSGSTKYDNVKSYVVIDGQRWYYEPSSQVTRTVYRSSDKLAETYTVTFNPNGGTVSPTNKTVTKGSTYGTLPTAKPTPEMENNGSMFSGWYTSASGGGNVRINETTTVDISANQTLYARWGRYGGAVSLDVNGIGTVEPNKIGLITGDNYGKNGNLPIPVAPAGSGYTFIGWSTEKDGGVFVTDNSIFTGSVNTLYAQWTKDNVNSVVSIPGKLNGIQLTAIMTEVGTKFDWTPIKDNVWGYRIYRSEIQGVEGISITDFPIVNVNQYVDVNVDSNKMYYYTIREVLAEASFDQVKVEIIDEILGGTSEELAIKTYLILDPELPPNVDGTEGPPLPPEPPSKSFILMEIDNKIMQVDDETFEIDPGRDTVPLNLKGRVMVPVRCVAETVGGIVGWEDSEKKVTIDANGHNVIMWLNQKGIIVDGENATVDVVPQSINDRTMLPVRFVAENIGCQITWIGSKQQIIIVFYR